MEENIITTEQVAETAEDIIVATGSNDWLKTAGKIGAIAIAVVAVGVAVDKTIKYVKAKKQQTDETAEEFVADIDSTDSEK